MKILNSKSIENIFSKKQSLKKITKEKQKIIIDYREKNSLVPSYLNKEFEIEFKELKIGDYLAKNVIIERKTISDFLNSMFNNHLRKQLQELQQFENKFLILEGFEEQEIYPENENSVRGFILSIILKYKIPIIYTKNPEDTAKFISVLTKKQNNQEFSWHGKKKTLNKKEQLQFIIESFPGIGPKKSKKLLEKFKTIQNIILAPTEELKEILGKKAETVREIIEREYKTES